MRIHADGSFHYVGYVRLVLFRIEVLQLLAGVLLMLAQVEVCARVDSLHLLEAEGHLELDVGSRIGIVSQLVVVVEAVLVGTEAERLVPLHAECLPVLEPLQLLTRCHEKLHLHLLEFPHAEDELTGDDLAECLSDLGNAEGNLRGLVFCTLRKLTKMPCAVSGRRTWHRRRWIPSRWRTSG